MLRRQLGWAAVIVVMIVLGVGLAIGLRAAQTNNLAVEAAQTEIASLRDAVMLANERLEAQDSAPVAIPDVVVPPEVGETGGRGERGFQGFDGARGFQGDTGEQGLQGVNGVPGGIGETGSIGETGLRGWPGSDGADGEPGLNGTDGTNGKDGATGPAGTNGTNGRGVISVECVDSATTPPTSNWVITYTDETITTTPGPCRTTPAAPVVP